MLDDNSSSSSEEERHDCDDKMELDSVRSKEPGADLVDSDEFDSVKLMMYKCAMWLQWMGNRNVHACFRQMSARL